MAHRRAAREAAQTSSISAGPRLINRFYFHLNVLSSNSSNVALLHNNAWSTRSFCLTNLIKIIWLSHVSKMPVCVIIKKLIPIRYSLRLFYI